MSARLLLCTAGLADVSIVILFFLVRTDAPLQSPWQLFSPVVFLVFGLSTAALWMAAGEKQDHWLIGGLCVHAFTATSLSAVVYTLGFGFDPLLHQAAEIAWQQQGPPHPFSILYSGQYALVSALARLTHLSVPTIDRWLVPLLASLTPPIVISGLTSAWRLPRHLAPRAAFALFLVPFAPFTFTIPFHLGVICFVWILAWLPAPPPLVRLALFFLAGVSVATHPLIGIPTVVLLAAHQAGLFIKETWAKAAAALLLLVASTTALPAAFLWRYRDQLSTAVDWPGIFQPTAWLGHFRDPYPFAGWGWETLYLFRLTIPLLLTLAAAGAAWRFSPSSRKLVGTLVLFLTGLLGASYILTTIFKHPGIIAYEQYEFPLRIIHLIPLAAFPMLALALAQLSQQGQIWKRGVVCLGVGLFTTTSWFFSYPQWNAKAHWSGPSASAQDIAIVSAIEAHATGTPHVALAAPITSALAVRTFGFRSVPGGMLWYPLPTGDVLYPYYLQLSQTPEASLAQEAARVSGVKRIYVVRNQGAEAVDNNAATTTTIRVQPYGILIDIYDTP